MVPSAATCDKVAHVTSRETSLFPMEGIQYLTEHYQKTYELTYAAWKSRNNTFLALLAAISVASLVTFPILGTRTLLFLYFQHLLGLKDGQLHELHAGFPFGILQAIALFVIFYLTVNLYHRALYVLMNYAYLGALEAEIRAALGLSRSSISFSRESSFYWGKRDPLLWTVKWVYIILLSLLLIAFLAGTMIQDWRGGEWFRVVIDAVFGGPTLLYLFAYAKASVKLDRKEAVVHDNLQT